MAALGSGCMRREDSSSRQATPVTVWEEGKPLEQRVRDLLYEQSRQGIRIRDIAYS